MTKTQLIMEDFDEINDFKSVNQQLLSEEEVLDEKLKSFEKGYATGWEDAEKHRSEKFSNLSTKLEQLVSDAEINLAAKSNRIAEKYAALLASIVQMMKLDRQNSMDDSVISTFLTEIAPSQHPLANATVSVNPIDQQTLEGMLDGGMDLVKVVSSSSVEQGNLQLEFDSLLVEVSPSTILKKIDTAISSLKTSKEVTQNES